MAKILLHDQQYIIGGPSAVLNGIEKSIIAKDNELIRIKQPESCGKNPIKAIRFIKHYRNEINKYHADSIYICGLQYAGFLMTVASKLSNVKKVVLSVHGSEWDNDEKNIRKWLLKYIIEPLEVRLADSVITVCQSAQYSVKALLWVQKGHNDGVVYNTIPSISYNDIEAGNVRKEFDISESKLIVACVGRVVFEKGHQFIIDSIKHYPDPDFVYIIVGDGDYLDYYKKTCKKEIEERRIILTGVRHDVNRILKDADIFLFPTLHENHSIALLEAVNMRCAVLCTNIGGNPEIIQDNYSGILIPPRDSKAISDGLKKMKDVTLREKFINNAYTFATVKFSEANTYGKLERILTSV